MISNIIRIAANAPQRLQPKDSRECGTVVIFRGALFDANMVSSQVEQIVLVASPPQIRVVGFCAKTSAEALTDTISASPHAVAESPLSRMLRSATWPCLRLRLGKNGISPSCNALVCQTHCSTSPTLTNRVHSMPQSSVSSSPISIPGACRSVGCLRCGFTTGCLFLGFSWRCNPCAPAVGCKKLTLKVPLYRRVRARCPTWCVGSFT